MKKRSFTRYDAHMKATYFLEERNMGWEDCTITKLSRKGMGITFHTEEEIPSDTTLHLKIFTSDEKHFYYTGFACSCLEWEWQYPQRTGSTKHQRFWCQLLLE